MFGMNRIEDKYTRKILKVVPPNGLSMDTFKAIKIKF